MRLRGSARRTFAIVASVLLAACAAPAPPEGAVTAPAPRVATAPAAGGASPAKAAVPLSNPSFELARVGGSDRAEGWSATQHVGPTAYTFTLDRSTKRSGDASLRIRNLRPEVYGSITQRIEAAPYIGQSLRFSVWLRTDNVVPNAYGKGATPLLQAWAGGSPAVSASFEVAAVAGTSEWVRREVGIDVPPATEWIEVGVMLTGSGTVWLDDAALEASPR